MKLDKATARDLYRKYKTHVHYSKPEDRQLDKEIMRAYQLIAQGRMVIKALESIKDAGLDAFNLPKLAIAPADAETCDCRVETNGAVRFDGRRLKSYYSGKASLRSRSLIQFPRGSFKPTRDVWSATAILPPVPVHLRPKRGLANYHILWEAEWSKIVPKDPLLLRRIGQADLWLVVAAWDLTEVERAALSTRIAG